MFLKYNYKILILTLIFVFLTTTGLGCKATQPDVAELKKVQLNVWGVWERAKDLNTIITAFQKSHPNISIKYRQFRYSEYEEQILKARANRKEPDIIFIHNTWVGDYLDQITPMPESISSTTISLEGSIKKEEVVKTQTKPTPSLKKIKDTYLPVVYDDLIRNVKAKKSKKKTDQAISLPLYVDSLVLFYNKDILNNAGIIDPPKTWGELQEDVKIITKQDTQGRIIQSGVSLGTSNNIERYFDILSLLMMQSGSDMANQGTPTFASITRGSGLSYGAQSLRFYTDFATPTKNVYTWNKSMTNSLDEFADGKVAFTFGYSYHIQRIRSKNPKLNFEITSIPQISSDATKAVNYASYWTPVVLNTSLNDNEAWDFIVYATSPKVVDSFLEASKRPPAIKEYLTKYENDFDLAPFVGQSLTAKSWYVGKNANSAELSFKRMIDKVLSSEGVVDDKIYEDAVRQAASEISKGY